MSTWQSAARRYTVPPAPGPRGRVPKTPVRLLREDDGAVAVDQHPVLEVPLDGARQDRALDVAPDLGELIGALAVGDAARVLLDDRAGVEVLVDVVCGGADQLDAALAGLGVRVGTGERRQER